MSHTAAASHSPSAVPKRPKGILKNTSSFQQQNPHQQISPEPRISPANELSRSPMSIDGGAESRPPMPGREMSEKEITQMNTEINAGGHRRNSSNPRANISRRQSSQTDAGGVNGEQDEGNVRLKWDEANLYLNEGQMGGKMKIMEPKTPYARNYDPAEDEDEIENINAQELAVDELDMNKTKARNGTASGSRARESEIPGLDLGEPTMDPLIGGDSDGERRVHVDQTAEDDGRHGEEEEDMSFEEREKHKKFEEMRKKHYEMKNIKNLLGHPEQLDMDEDDE